MINNKIQATMSIIEQMAVNEMRQEIDSLAKTILPNVILTSLQLYQSLEFIEKCSDDVSGHIKEKCQEIQKGLIQVLDKLIASESLRKMYNLSKKNQLVDDYDVPEDGQISDLTDQVQGQQQQQQTSLDHIKQLIQGFEDSKFEQGEIIGYPTLQKLGIRLDNLLANYGNDLTSALNDSNEESKDESDTNSLSSLALHRTNVNRDVILEINDQGYVKNDESKKSSPKENTQSTKKIHVQFGTDIDENSETTDSESKKEESSKITISKQQLENFQKRSADMYSSLLQSINTYDVGKISENCDPEHLPTTTLDKPRYALLARLTRNIQRILLTRLRSALKNQYTKQQEQVISNEDLQFEFVFCVDNSGSMSGKKIREALNTLVILMETFHRL
ncbi:unnamed protein product [Rotaria sp. Silwood2]|nr:unnamed protein product [Rotaria sp. Silwood2]